MYFVKNVYHHGLIEMLHVHSVDVNYQLDKRIFVMDLRRDILFGTKLIFFSLFSIIEHFMENYFNFHYIQIFIFFLKNKKYRKFIF